MVAVAVRSDHGSLTGSRSLSFVPFLSFGISLPRCFGIACGVLLHWVSPLFSMAKDRRCGFFFVVNQSRSKQGKIDVVFG